MTLIYEMTSICESRADTAALILPRRYCRADTACRRSLLGASVAGVLHWWDALGYLSMPWDTLQYLAMPWDTLGYLVRHPAEACAWLCVVCIDLAQLLAAAQLLHLLAMLACSSPSSQP